jgi:hypothetical protein
MLEKPENYREIFSFLRKKEKAKFFHLKRGPNNMIARVGVVLRG